MKTILFAALITANSPYIAKVYEFTPAPGQFLNDVPEVSDDVDPLDAVEEQIAKDQQPGLISLGAFGGYVVFGFDHPVVNVRGEADFKIYGNALLTSAEQKTGSSEPGIIWVSEDTNGNGMPDDEWYELKGSEWERTERGLTVTYFKPTADHEPVPDSKKKYLLDAEYIRWVCSDGTEGWIEKNNQHPQDYWPAWIEEDRIVFENVSRLPDNAVDTTGRGTNFTSYMYDWGYADNRPNTETDGGFDITDAVDAEGEPVELNYIHFVKVQTAVRQNLGWLGESSTEIAGAEDLHPDAELPEKPDGVTEISRETNSRSFINLGGLPAERGICIDPVSRKLIFRR